ncbi:MAG: hypothetical protein ACRCTR_09515 [Actinomycetota bacterium]
MKGRTIRAHRTAQVIAGAAVVVATVTSCSGDNASDDKGPSKSASATVSPLVTPTEENIVNEPDARQDVQTSGCAKQDGGWGAEGQVKNSGDKDASYTVVISFTNEKSTVLARDEIKVTVPKGESKKWSAKAKFKAPKNVVCVLRGVDRNEAKS